MGRPPAKNPRGKRMVRETDTRNMNVGQLPDIDINAANGGGVVQPVDKPLSKDYMDELAFMEEIIEIMVHEADDPAAENPVAAGNNGRVVYFQRGVPKPTAFQPRNFSTVPVSGQGQFAEHQPSNIRFPLSVIRTQEVLNGCVDAWLKRLDNCGSSKIIAK